MKHRMTLEEIRTEYQKYQDLDDQGKTFSPHCLSDIWDALDYLPDTDEKLELEDKIGDLRMAMFEV